MSQKLVYPHDFFDYSANERTDSSETSVHIYQTTQRHIPPKTPVFNDGGIVPMPWNRKTSLVKQKCSLTIQCVF